jgi:hypothetical protein
MNTKLLAEVDSLAKHMQQTQPWLRQGQSLMNALHECSKETYDKITCTDADCFYIDAAIEKFYQQIVS